MRNDSTPDRCRSPARLTRVGAKLPNTSFSALLLVGPAEADLHVTVLRRLAVAILVTGRRGVRPLFPLRVLRAERSFLDLQLFGVASRGVYGRAGRVGADAVPIAADDGVDNDGSSDDGVIHGFLRGTDRRCAPVTMPFMIRGLGLEAELTVF